MVLLSMLYRLQFFNRERSYLKQIGSVGSSPLQFYFPYGVAVDKNDRIIVSEHGNDRVQVLSRDGDFSSLFGKEGKGNGEFNSPDVDDDGNIYVADYRNQGVQKLDRDGKFVSVIGRGKGNGDGQLNRPWDVAVNGDALCLLLIE